MAKLVILSGIPGSGKSTFINNYNWDKPIVVLSTDKIRQKLTGDAGDLSKDKLVWKSINLELSNPQVNATYIVDATNLTEKRRKSYLRFKKKFDTITLIYLSVPLKTALKRNAARSRHVPEDVIERMYKTTSYNYDELIEAGYDAVMVVANR